MVVKLSFLFTATALFDPSLFILNTLTNPKNGIGGRLMISVTGNEP